METKESPPSVSLRRSRRRAAIIGLGVAAVAGKMVFDSSHSSETTPSRSPEPTIPADVYADWEQYRDKQLPVVIVRTVGRDIAALSKYQGMETVGRLIVASQDHIQELTTIYPPLAGHRPIEVQFLETVKQYKSVAFLSTDFYGQKHSVEIRNRTTGQKHTTPFVFPEKLTLWVGLDNSAYLAPKVAKQLLLAKEFAHLLYIQQHMEFITDQVRQTYEIDLPKGVDLAQVLWANAISYAGNPDPTQSLLGDRFVNALDDLDGAAFWHTTLAFGQMKSEGLFTPLDFRALSAGNAIFEHLKARGELLIEQPRGRYQWKPGIGPFSPEFTAPMRTILSLSR